MSLLLLLAYLLYKDVQMYINNSGKLLQMCAGDQDLCSFNGPGSAPYKDSYLNNNIFLHR